MNVFFKFKYRKNIIVEFNVTIKFNQYLMGFKIDGLP